MQYTQENFDRFEQFITDIRGDGFLAHTYVDVCDTDISRNDPIADLHSYFDWYEGTDDPLSSFMKTRWLLNEAMEQNLKFPVCGYWSVEEKQIKLNSGRNRSNVIAWTGTSKIPMFYLFLYGLSEYYPTQYFPVWDLGDIDDLPIHLEPTDLVSAHREYIFPNLETSRYDEQGLSIISLNYEMDEHEASTQYNKGFMKELSTMESLKVIISSSNLYDFGICKKQIEKHLIDINLNGKPFPVEFIDEPKHPYMVDHLIEKYGKGGGFVIYTDANVKWNTNIYEMIYWFDLNKIGRAHV